MVGFGRVRYAPFAVQKVRLGDAHLLRFASENISFFNIYLLKSDSKKVRPELSF